MTKMMAALVEANTNTSAALVKLSAQKDANGSRVHSTMRVQIPTDWPKYGDDGTYDGDPKRFYFHLENMFCLANDGNGLSWHERWIALGHSLKGKRKIPYNRVLNVMQRDSKRIPDCAEVAYDEVKQRHLK